MASKMMVIVGLLCLTCISFPTSARRTRNEKLSTLRLDATGQLNSSVGQAAGKNSDTASPRVKLTEGLKSSSGPSGENDVCQYIPKPGRPYTKSGKWRKKYLVDGWPEDGLPSGSPMTLTECRETCDRVEACVGFVRYATENTFYLDEVGLIHGISKLSEEESKKWVLRRPEDYEKAACWLLKGAELKLNRGQPMMNRERKEGKMSGREKVTYEQRNCNCAFRYLGVARFPQLLASVASAPARAPSSATLTSGASGASSASARRAPPSVPVIPAECEGIFKPIAKEFTPTAENIYQKLEVDRDEAGKIRVRSHYLYTCGVPVGNDTFVRQWFCADADSMKNFQQHVKRHLANVSSGSSTVGNYMYETFSVVRRYYKNDVRKMTQLETCPGVRVSPEVDPATNGWSTRREKKKGQSLGGPEAPAILLCAKDKEEALKQQKKFRVSQMQRCGDSSFRGKIAEQRQTVLSWLQRASSALSAIGKAPEVDLARLGEVVGNMVEVIYRVKHIMANKDVWVRTVCAQELILMVKEVKGIFPKVAQNLALQPNIVKDDFVRNVLKETQTDNDAEDEGEVARRLVEPRPGDGPVLWNGRPVLEMIDMPKAITIGVGSVGQVLMVGIKDPALKAALGGKSKAVLKVVFAENEARYAQDWELLEFAMGWVSWAQGKLDAKNDKSLGARFLRTLNHYTYNITIPQAVTKTTDIFKKLKTSMMDEFNLLGEAEFSARGKAIADSFPTAGLKGTPRFSIKVPRVVATSSKFALFQELAEGVLLKKYITNIEGSPMELVQFKEQVFDSIIQFYGYSLLSAGFWQGDPHPGNWFYNPANNQLWQIDWGAVGDLRLGESTPSSLASITGPQTHCRLAKYYRALAALTAEFQRRCSAMELRFEKPFPFPSGAVRSLPLFASGTTTDYNTYEASTTYWGDFPGSQHMKLYLFRDDAFGWVLSIMNPHAKGQDGFQEWILQCAESEERCKALELASLGSPLMFKQPDGHHGLGPKGSKGVVNVGFVFARDDPACSAETKGLHLAQIVRDLGFEVLVDRKERPFSWQQDEVNVLSLFAALQDTNIDELLVRMKNIEGDDPDADVVIPTDLTYHVRSMQAFNGIVQDLIEGNGGTVPKSVLEYVRNSAFGTAAREWDKYAAPALAHYGGDCQSYVVTPNQWCDGANINAADEQVRVILEHVGLLNAQDRGNSAFHCREVGREVGSGVCQDACTAMGDKCVGFTYFDDKKSNTDGRCCFRARADDVGEQEGCWCHKKA